jgi:hypothetical protein
VSIAARLFAIGSFVFAAIWSISDWMGRVDELNRASVLLIQGVVFLIYAEVLDMRADRAGISGYWSRRQG